MQKICQRVRLWRKVQNTTWIVKIFKPWLPHRRIITSSWSTLLCSYLTNGNSSESWTNHQVAIKVNKPWNLQSYTLSQYEVMNTFDARRDANSLSLKLGFFWMAFIKRLWYLAWAWGWRWEFCIHYFLMSYLGQNKNKHTIYHSRWLTSVLML